MKTTPSTLGVPALVPLSRMSGEPAKPGCVVASIVTGSVTDGSADVGAMVCAPPPPMLKSMTSAPALASRIAWRSDPAPESLVFVTV